MRAAVECGFLIQIVLKIELRGNALNKKVCVLYFLQHFTKDDSASWCETLALIHMIFVLEFSTIHLPKDPLIDFLLKCLQPLVVYCFGWCALEWLKAATASALWWFHLFWWDSGLQNGQSWIGRGMKIILSCFFTLMSLQRLFSAEASESLVFHHLLLSFWFIGTRNAEFLANRIFWLAI